MYQLELEMAILMAALAGVAGLAIGILLHRSTSTAEEENRKLRQSLADAEAENRDYQQQVAQHFSTTAHMLNDLTEKYKDVHHHLAAGANSLCRDAEGNSLLADDSHLVHQQPAAPSIEQKADPDSLQPPLDYAPKSAQGNVGTLAEDYGLEKINLHEEQSEEESANAPGQRAAS